MQEVCQGWLPQPGFEAALRATYCGILFFLKTKSSSDQVCWIFLLSGASIVLLRKFGAGYMLLFIILAIYTLVDFSDYRILFN